MKLKCYFYFFLLFFPQEKSSSGSTSRPHIAEHFAARLQTICKDATSIQMAEYF